MLNEVLKRYPLQLPRLCSHIEPILSSQYNQIGDLKKRSELTQRNTSSSLKNKGNGRKALKSSENLDSGGKLKQPTIIDMFSKASATTSQEILNENSSCMASKECRSEATEKEAAESDRLLTIDVSAVMNVVEAQRYKFRPLHSNCFAILAFTKNQDSCCADPEAVLPLYLYLLRDLCQKVEYVHPLNKHISPRYASTSPGFSQIKAAEFLSKMKPLFPSLKHYLDCAVRSLGEGTDICQDHWEIQSDMAGNPDKVKMIATNVLVYNSVVRVTLGFFSKMINIPDVLDDKSALADLLVAFQPIEFSKCIVEGMESIPPPGSIGYFYVGAYSFLEGIYNIAITLSINLASQVVLALESVVMSIQMFLNKSIHESAKEIQVTFTKEHLHFLSNRLGTLALKLLSQKHDGVTGNSPKIKGEMVQKILHIYLRYNDPTSDALNDLACSILPQVAPCGTGVNDSNAFPVLCPATFIVWYRVLHEENLSLINNLIKEAARLEKPSAGAKEENAGNLLNKLHQSVNVVVSLINICRTHHKVSVHTMAVKYGGKFIDAFLKVFYFLEAQFQMHQALIIAMVKELQKATRTIQTLCSEAKASKRTAITSKIPATKRSLERFLFHVKALLHATPTECTFWMGNLKHKDLMGQVVSSQAYLDLQNETIWHSSETMVQDEPVNAAE